MASKSIERYVEKQILPPEKWERILERLESGETQVSISRSIKRPDGDHISPGFFNRVLRRDPQRRAQVEQAMRAGASVQLDRGLELVNDAALDKDSIQKARAQFDAYSRVASLRDRERFGAQHQPIVQINVETLHLDSLRHRMVEASLPLAAALAVDEGERRGSAGHIGSDAGLAPVETASSDSKSIE